MLTPWETAATLTKEPYLIFVPQLNLFAWQDTVLYIYVLLILIKK